MRSDRGISPRLLGKRLRKVRPGLKTKPAPRPRHRRRAAARCSPWLLLGTVVLSVAGLLSPIAASVVGASGVLVALGRARASASPIEYSLVTEPVNGLGPIYNLITSARRTLDMTMYELSDPTAEAALAADAKRGVRVRVVLDQNLARSYNAAAFGYLSSHGVEVRWAPPSYDVTHQKTITVDGDVSAIMTLNLTSQYYATTRDFAVVDRDPADVAAIETVFENDFAGRSSSPEPRGANLVWSPGADAALVRVIGSAKHTLYVENEEMSEYTIVDALRDAARRGVDVEVVMTYQSSWQDNFDELVAAGVHVRTYSPNANLYIHAKVIDVDPGYPDEQVDIGSQNFSWGSLEHNRELGLDLGPAGQHNQERRCDRPVRFRRRQSLGGLIPGTFRHLRPRSGDDGFHAPGVPVLQARHTLWVCPAPGQEPYAVLRHRILISGLVPQVHAPTDMR